MTQGLEQAPRAQGSERPRFQANSLKNDAHSQLPGELYTLYSPRDAIGYLPEKYQVVVNRAARWVGVSEGYLSRVIEKYERRVIRWWARGLNSTPP